MYAEAMAGHKLYRKDVAEMLGIKWRSLGGVRRLPEPDGREIEGGYARPWWWESTIVAFRASRPGRGGRWT